MNALIAQIAAAKQQGGLAGLFLPILLLVGLVYMMIVPQRKQKKKQEEFLATLSIGDEVVTSGGIHGLITFLEDDLVHMEVDTDVVIRVSKSAVSRRDAGVVDLSDTDGATSSTAAPSDSTSTTAATAGADSAPGAAGNKNGASDGEKDGAAPTRSNAKK